MKQLRVEAPRDYRATGDPMLRYPSRYSAVLRRGKVMASVRPEENKTLVARHFTELLALGELVVADEIYDSDYLNHTLPPATNERGPECEKRQVVLWRTAFSDLQVTIREVIAEGDQIIVRWTVGGVDTGGFMGKPPTYRPIMLDGVKIVRVLGGRIIEGWDIIDMLDLQQQLGLSTHADAPERANDASSGENHTNPSLGGSRSW